MSKTRLAGVFYLLVFVTGMLSLVVPAPLGSRAVMAAGVLYIVVTVLLYQLFKPVDHRVSLIAACVSFAGIAVGPLRVMNPLVVFGLYCALIGYLSLKSSFVPRVVGVLMVFAGLGWLTFASPSLARSLSPFNFAPGLIGEGALTVWLLFTRANEQPGNAVRI
jgi:uncharacterized protein DUF4386